MSAETLCRPSCFPSLSRLPNSNICVVFLHLRLHDVITGFWTVYAGNGDESGTSVKLNSTTPREFWKS